MQSVSAELRAARREFEQLAREAPEVYYPSYVREWVIGLNNSRDQAIEDFMNSISMAKTLPKELKKHLDGGSLTLIRIYIKDQVHDREIQGESDYIGRFVKRCDPVVREWIESKIEEYRSIEEAHSFETAKIPENVQKWADWRTKHFGGDPNVRYMSDLDLVAFVIGNY